MSYPGVKAKIWSECDVIGCSNCGFSYVSNFPFSSVSEYYKNQYGIERKRNEYLKPEIFFSESNKTRQYILQLKRAKRHIGLADIYKPNYDTILDVGCGAGIALSISSASKKIAIEEDILSKPYLEFLGVNLSSFNNVPDEDVDVVIASHFLEHILIGDIPKIINFFSRVLRKDGIVICEVPAGSLLSHDLSKLRHDPHTLFFSPESLELLFHNYGFQTIFLDSAASGENPKLQQPIYKTKKTAQIYSSGKGGITLVLKKITKKNNQTTNIEVYPAADKLKFSVKDKRARVFRAFLGAHEMSNLIGNNKSRMLDIGGAFGVHARYFRENCSNLTVDILDTKQSSEKLVYEGDYLEFRVLEKYEYIWCSHVVEHLRNPGIFFDKVFLDLADNGWVGITVPPSKNDMTFQHVTLWNAGLVLIHLIHAGFDCTNAHIATYGYNITVIAQKRYRGSKPMPKCLPSVNKRGIYFEGNIDKLNWSERGLEISERYSNLKITEIEFSPETKSQFMYALDDKGCKKVYYYDSSLSETFLTG